MMDEKEDWMKVDRVKQYKTMLHIECVGHPSVTKGQRISCNRNVALKVIDARNSTEIKQVAKVAGWRFFKTLGKNQFFCPSCSERILKMRKEQKFIWG